MYTRVRYGTVPGFGYAGYTKRVGRVPGTGYTIYDITYNTSTSIQYKRETNAPIS